MNHLKTHQTNPTTAQYCPVQSNISTAQYSQVQPIPEPDPKPELFGQTRPEPDPKSKIPTRQTLVIRTDALKPGQLSIFTASYIGPVFILFGLYLSKSSKYSAVKFEWRCAEKVELAPQFV